MLTGRLYITISTNFMSKSKDWKFCHSKEGLPELHLGYTLTGKRPSIQGYQSPCLQLISLYFPVDYPTIPRNELSGGGYITLGLTTANHTVPYYTKPYYSSPYYSISNCHISYKIIQKSYRTTPYLTLPKYTTPHIKPYYVYQRHC